MGSILPAVAVMTTSGVSSLHYSTRAWIAIAEQGLLATASTRVLWNWGLQRVPASQAGIFVNLEPLVGAILGVSLLHENLGAMAFAGGALIVGGAMYFSYKPEAAVPGRGTPCSATKRIADPESGQAAPVHTIPRHHSPRY
jgi:drug/metabolite transporter (DMT)-like permease